MRASPYLLRPRLGRRDRFEGFDAWKAELVVLPIDALEHAQFERRPLVTAGLDGPENAPYAEPFTIGPFSGDLVPSPDGFGHFELGRVAEGVAQRLELAIMRRQPALGCALYPIAAEFLSQSRHASLADQSVRFQLTVR